jgi:hypothetical protein
VALIDHPRPPTPAFNRRRRRRRSDLQIRPVTPPGGILMFSGAQFHALVPINGAGRALASTFRRSVSTTSSRAPRHPASTRSAAARRSVTSTRRATSTFTNVNRLASQAEDFRNQRRCSPGGRRVWRHGGIERWAKKHGREPSSSSARRSVRWRRSPRARPTRRGTPAAAGRVVGVGAAHRRHQQRSNHQRPPALLTPPGCPAEADTGANLES